MRRANCGELKANAAPEADREEIKKVGYNIIVLDLDGTLTNRDKVITPRTKEALMRAQEQGKIVVLASGRPTAGVKPLAEELEHSLEARGLADWQPELCLEALCICHAVWSGLETPEARTRAATIAAAICRIRPSRSPFL